MNVTARAMNNRLYGRVNQVLGTDAVVRSSVMLALTAATMGALGFVFWMIATRLFDADTIGIGTTLVSATSLISYMSLAGFNYTLLQVLPTDEDGHEHIDTGLTLAFVAAATIALAYIVIAPEIAPELHGVRANGFYVTAFALLTSCSAVNLLTDSVFVARRRAEYNLLVDGVIQSGAKVALLFVFVPIGLFGVYLASGVAAALAVAVSLFLLRRSFDYRWHPRIRLHVLRRLLRLSLANYAGSVLGVLPVLIVPIVILRLQGSKEAAYFYVAFQIANLTYTGIYSVSVSFVAEGSRERVNGSNRAGLRSLQLLTLVSLVGMVVLVAGNRLLLGLFSSEYARNSGQLLIAFGLAGPAVALRHWAESMLRVKLHLRAIVIEGVVYALGVCAFTVATLHRGVEWAGWSWLAGNALAAATGLILLRAASRHSSRPDHGHHEDRDGPDDGDDREPAGVADPSWSPWPAPWSSPLPAWPAPRPPALWPAPQPTGPSRPSRPPRIRVTSSYRVVPAVIGKALP
ncbi:MAG: lipopolysaccharide biosynthesis protein [Acidimicrobiia bacterium]